MELEDCGSKTVYITCLGMGVLLGFSKPKGTLADRGRGMQLTRFYWEIIVMSYCSRDKSPH